MTVLTEQLGDLIAILAIAIKRMQERNVAVEALRRIADLDPKGIACKPMCSCMGCIARRALAEAGEEL